MKTLESGEDQENNDCAKPTQTAKTMKMAKTTKMRKRAKTAKATKAAKTAKTRKRRKRENGENGKTARTTKTVFLVFSFCRFSWLWFSRSKARQARRRKQTGKSFHMGKRENGFLGFLGFVVASRGPRRRFCVLSEEGIYTELVWPNRHVHPRADANW